MAYTDTPSTNVEQNKKINLMAVSHSRSPTTNPEIDYTLINGVFEFEQNKGLKDEFRGIFKRDGVSVYINNTNTDTFLGWYYWAKWNISILFFGPLAVVYSGNTSIGTFTTPFTNAGGSLGFTEYLYDSGVVSLIATNGTTLIEINTTNGTAFTTITATDPDLPSPHIPKPLFMNGYLFLVKKDTADLYNSDLNLPLTWTPGDFISAESFPDGITTIARINTYIAVFGTSSIELFYDAANASGSPLKKYDISVRKVGTLSNICEYENQLLFIGKSSNTPPKLYLMEDLKLQDIIDPVVNRWFSSIQNTEFTVAVTNHTGHTFFVVSAAGQSWQYDIEFKTWSKLKFGNTNSFEINSSYTQNNTYQSIFTLKNNSTIFSFNSSVYQDVTGNSISGYSPQLFTLDILTDRENFQTYRPKFTNRLRVHTDKRTGTDNLQIRWSDDDYATFSSFRTFPISNLGGFLFQLGSFVDRAWNIRYTGNNPLRVYELELDYILGTN